MSIRDYKITDAQIAEKGVIASPDTLTGTADENKRVFDRLVRECVAPQFNEIVETFADMEESTTEWSGEEAKRQQAEQGRVSAETARMTAEDDRAQEESTRRSAETARQQAESARDTAENARANAENKRDTAEKSRVSAETGRVNAESARVTAESQRANAESVRAQNEAARISAETGRADAEADRVSAEDTRIANENARKSAETDRASAETVRESGENARKSAEKARASAEQQRESTESTRQTNETARVSAEKSRAAAETARQTAEKARNVWEEYSAGKAYVPGNKVSFNGSSYVCTAASTGHAPTDTAYWLLIAQKGADGKGAGDMLASVYDPKGKAQDVFQYADAKASAAQSAAATYTDDKIAAIPTPDVSGQIETHNTAENAHSALFQTVNSAAAAAKSAAANVQANLKTHTADKNNPHNVTADQAGAAAKDLSNVQFGLAFEAATLPSSEIWQSVCYGNDEFVAVATNSNKAAYSVDGITWTAATLPSSESWWSVCYGNDEFVAVATNSNKAVYSADGITWTAAKLPVPESWQSVCYGNGKFVAVAYGGSKAVYSADGITWTAATLPGSEGWQSVCYGNGKFVAVADESNKAAYADASPSIVEQLCGAGLAKAPVAHKVTLTASGWNSSTKKQTVNCADVVADETAQQILPMPAAASLSAYNDAGILCTGQGAGTLTFQCKTVPTAAITVYVTITPVNFS